MKREYSIHERYARIKVLGTMALALLLIAIAGTIYMAYNFSKEEVAQQEVLAEVENQSAGALDLDRIENGVHVRTGLIDAEGLMAVVTNCTSCHSAKIITQNRLTADRWDETIKWMQDKQGLWDLGKNHEVIINYLVTNYPYKKKGRRQLLENIEWYELKDHEI